MPKERAKKLFYLGGVTRDAGDYFAGVPQRDLDEADIERMTDAQYDDAIGKHPTLGPLYQTSAPRKGKGDDGDDDAPAAPRGQPAAAPEAAEAGGKKG